MNFITVVSQFSVVSVGICRIFCQAYYEPLVNVISEIDEFNGRHDNLVRFFNYFRTTQNIAAYCASFLVYADKNCRNILISI